MCFLTVVNSLRFSQRNSRGPKLGASIAGDLRKKATQKIKDAQKATTSRKPSRGAKKELAVETTVIDVGRHDMSKLDIKIPAKDLTDDGLAVFAEGLEEALRASSELALTDLDLSGNQLTVQSLSRLAPIIRDAHLDLHCLNLSSNNIEVTTAAQGKEWEMFLESLNNCCNFRRLDLSHNGSLGHLSFEILAQVYMRSCHTEPQIVITDQNEQCDVGAPRENGLPLDDGRNDGSEALRHSRDDSLQSKLARAENSLRRGGISSISYFSFDSVGLSDAGALFLSSVLKQHKFPHQLLPSTDITDTRAQTGANQQITLSAGIDWNGNEQTISRDGRQLLDAAAKVRLALHDDGIDRDGSSATDSDDDTGERGAEACTLER